jgi:hypothetical protein
MIDIMGFVWYRRDKLEACHDKINLFETDQASPLYFIKHRRRAEKSYTQQMQKEVLLVVQ